MKVRRLFPWRADCFRWFFCFKSLRDILAQQDFFLKSRYNFADSFVISSSRDAVCFSAVFFFVKLSFCFFNVIFYIQDYNGSTFVGVGYHYVVSRLKLLNCFPFFDCQFRIFQWSCFFDFFWISMRFASISVSTL